LVSVLKRREYMSGVRKSTGEVNHSSSVDWMKHERVYALAEAHDRGFHTALFTQVMHALVNHFGRLHLRFRAKTCLCN
jgi:hypothetical protein